MSTVLTIAGFDPTSGAGVTADLAVFAAHGLFGTSVITALTSQSTVGVRSVRTVEGEFLRETLEVLEEDLPADGIKIGMLGSGEGVAAVVDFLEGLRERGRQPWVVLDPVMRSSSGKALLDEAGVELLRERLMPLVDWVTPNVEELGVLIRRGVGALRGEIVAAGREVQGPYSGTGLVVTGGHLEPPDDLVLAGGEAVWLTGVRVETSATHGTGCAFSSAFLCGLVLGADAVSAARAAKEYVAEAMRRAVPRGRGRGPMEHLWPLRKGLGMMGDGNGRVNPPGV